MQRSVIRMFDGSPERSLAPGEVLFRTGDPVAQMVLVREGVVVLERIARRGGRIVLQQAHDGAVVSEASAYATQYQCDAVAAGDGARVALLPLGDFHNRLESDTETMRAWAAGLAQTVQVARLRAELRSLRTVSDRLDGWLGKQRGLPPRGAWHGLAVELGVSREALYRELARRREAAEI
ncbi:Crp/Fnr family transcriptional regulator [Phaeovulum sp.]|uniref:Crp/Fnr family transcriptional regulator n=1 Tax=Phaeovulum sp. TaxID=2934796 RepID=UPI0035649329